MRIFFFKAHVTSGDFDCSKIDHQIASDFLWLNRDEAGQLFASEGSHKYWKAISSSLLMERLSDQSVSGIIARVKASALKHAAQRQTGSRGIQSS